MSVKGTVQQNGAPEPPALYNTPIGVSLAVAARVSLLYLKKYAVLVPIKKQAFLRIGRLTTPDDDAPPPIDGKWTSRSALMPHVRYLMKNSILGITVFGTYEYLAIHSVSPADFSRRFEDVTLNNDETIVISNSSYSLAATQLSLLKHYGAGACAGLAHSTVMTIWDLVTHRSTFLKSTRAGSLPRYLRRPFLQRRAVHHMLGYSSLFGTFEAVRRTLLHSFYHLMEDSERIPELLDQLECRHWIRPSHDGTYDITPVTLASAFVAGGVAGQAQHVVSHFTSHWHLQALEGTMPKPLGTGGNATAAQRIRHWIKYTFHQLPSVRSNITQFVPTAFCFLAFEYGTELTERVIKEASG